MALELTEGTDSSLTVSPDILATKDDTNLPHTKFLPSWEETNNISCDLLSAFLASTRRGVFLPYLDKPRNRVKA